MGRENPAKQTLKLLRSRLCNPSFIFSAFSEGTDSNYSKLKFIVSSSVTEACNNSVLLLGPRGCGKTAVLELVLKDVVIEYPDMISVIRLNGMLHADDNCAIKEIARQLCLEHKLSFSKMVSFDDNSQFMIAMLHECGLAHKTIIFVLDEFDLFSQGKQRLLYSLLDAMQSISSQAVVIGVSCRLDADQLLEKRVRSRFSHRKLLFLPPSKEDLERLLKHILSLPTDSDFPHGYATDLNANIHDVLTSERFKEIINSLTSSDSTVNHLLRFLFCAVSQMDMKSGFLSIENFESALPKIQRQPKMEALQECSILELYILVCMKRLEVKEENSFNFNSIMKEYKSVHDSFQTSDYYARDVCLRAFEHLLQRQLVCFTDSRGHSQSVEFRPVKLLVSFHELHSGLKAYRSCPPRALRFAGEVRDAEREEKVEYMMEILRRYCPDGERIRAQRQREYRQKIISNYKLENFEKGDIRYQRRKKQRVTGSVQSPEEGPGSGLGLMPSVEVQEVEEEVRRRLVRKDAERTFHLASRLGIKGNLPEEEMIQIFVNLHNKRRVGSGGRFWSASSFE
ncbi:unnamed protein product [Rhodiola kirilowii]